MDNFRWERLLKEANSDYDNGRISRNIYELRVKDAIYNLNKIGKTDVAIRVSKAHGYYLEDVIRDYENKNK